MKILLKSLLVMLFLLSFSVQAAEPVEKPDETGEEEEPECD